MSFVDSLLGRTHPSMIGLDISTSSVKLVELGQSAAGEFIVERFASEPFEKGWITDGQIEKFDEVADAVRRVAKKNRYHDLFASGGGTRNRTLMAMLRDEAAALGIEVATTDAAGVPSQAKEAIAFAVLAFQSWQRQSSNVPGATGAKREVILGKISYV